MSLSYVLCDYMTSQYGDAQQTRTLKILQRQQNIILREMVGSPWYVQNEIQQNDLHVEPVKIL